MSSHSVGRTLARRVGVGGVGAPRERTAEAARTESARATIARLRLSVCFLASGIGLASSTRNAGRSVAAADDDDDAVVGASGGDHCDTNNKMDGGLRKGRTNLIGK